MSGGVAIKCMGLAHFVCGGWHGVQNVDLTGLDGLGGSLWFLWRGVVYGAFCVCLAVGLDLR